MRALYVASPLEDVASALGDVDQFVPHRRSGGVANRTIQLASRATDLTVTADGFGEA